MKFWEQTFVHFQTRCRLKFFLPYGPILTKSTKKWKKSKLEIPLIFMQLWHRPSLEVKTAVLQDVYHYFSEGLAGSSDRRFIDGAGSRIGS